MKPRLCYTYCTLLLILLVSSGMLFILVASEASKPLGHQVHQNQHHQEEHSPRVPTTEHEPHPEESSPEKKPSGDEPSAFQPPSPPEVNVQSVSRTPSGVSELGGSENLGSDPPGRNGVRKVRKKTQRTSRRKDMLTEKPAKPDEPPDLKEVIFLETVSKNAGVTDSGNSRGPSWMRTFSRLTSMSRMLITEQNSSRERRAANDPRHQHQTSVLAEPVDDMIMVI